MITAKNIGICLLGLLAIGLSTWSIMMSTIGFRPMLNQGGDEADSFMEGIVATILNKDGSPSLKVMTPKMVHYPHNDITEIDTPYVTIYRNSPNPWFIVSEHAKAKNGIDQIQFSRNVNIHHSADTDNPNTEMMTELLTIFPEDEIASTDQPVTFIQPDTKIHAIGMLANLNDGTIKLLSQARGEYAPAS